MLVIFHLQLGIPSKHTSTTCADYVPALCTHRPSLLPIELSDELQREVYFNLLKYISNCNKSYNLEEGEVVTR